MKLNFNRAQLKQLAQTNGNLGVLFYGSVIAQSFPSIDDVEPWMIVLGLSLGNIFFIESLILLKGVKDNES